MAQTKNQKKLLKILNEIDFDNFDEIYINGNNNLEKVKLIEQEFKRLMFDE